MPRLTAGVLAIAAQTALVNSGWDLSFWYLHPLGRWGTHPFVTHWAGCKLCVRAEKFKPDAGLANGTVLTHRTRCMAIYSAYVAETAARVSGTVSPGGMHSLSCLKTGGRRTAQLGCVHQSQKAPMRVFIMPYHLLSRSCYALQVSCIVDEACQRMPDLNSSNTGVADLQLLA